MPSTSGKQHRLMAAVANNPKFAKRVGIPQSVGEEFVAADKGRKFGSGGRIDRQGINKPFTDHGKMAINRPKTDHGDLALFRKGGEMAESRAMVKKEVSFMKKKGAPKSMIKHEEAEMAGMKRGGKVKKFAAGGDTTMSNPSKERKGMTMEKMGKVTAGGIKKFGEHTVQTKGHTRGKNMGDSGKTVPIQRGAVGMKRGGKC